jgi:hypothetical protein
VEALRDSITTPGWCLVAFIDDQPLAIGGLADSHNADIGVPWMLCTNLIYSHRRAFLQMTQDVCARMRSEKPILSNYVAAANRDSIRWLKWLGFTVQPDAVAINATGVLFHHFFKVADHV